MPGSDHLLGDPLAGRGGGQPLSRRTRTFLTGAQLFCLQVCSAQRMGPRATDGLSRVPRRLPPDLGSTWRDPRGPDLPLPEKCQALFLKAPKIARDCCTSLLIIPPASAVNQGEDAPPPEPLSAAAFSVRAMPAGGGGCRVPAAGGRGAAAAQAREEEEPRRRRRQFPLSPALAPRAHAHCARSPGPYLSGLLERRRKREFGGVRSGGFRSDPQAV